MALIELKGIERVFQLGDTTVPWWPSPEESAASVPEPAAMRRLRDALMSSGLARSVGVIELLIPSIR